MIRCDGTLKGELEYVMWIRQEIMFINDHMINVSEHKSDFDMRFKMNLRNVKKFSPLTEQYICISANVWIHLNIMCTTEAITTLFASPNVFIVDLDFNWNDIFTRIAAPLLSVPMEILMVYFSILLQALQI